MNEYSQYLKSIAWPAARFRFEFEALSNIKFPPFAGSMLRGVFGYALRSVSCMTKQKECKGCPLQVNCPYSRIFEPKTPASVDRQKFSSVPGAYVFEPLQWGNAFYEPGASVCFDMVLLGEEISLVPLVIFALQKGMLRGIGHGEARLKAVFQVSDLGKAKIYEAGDEEIVDFERSFKLKRQFSSSCQLKLVTPLRVQREGKILNSEELTAKEFFAALIRRVDLVCRTHMNPIDIPFNELLADADNAKLSKNLSIREWTRYSNRQKSLMRLPGLIGELSFDNLSEPLFNFLELAEYFHVGKNAAFGLGRVKIL